MCKQRNQNGNYHRLLKFTSLSTTGEDLDIADSEIAELIKELYGQLLQQWNRLIDDANIQAVAPTGISLLNIFDVGPSQAAKDFLPFLNKYCKRAINFSCYNRERDGQALMEDTVSRRGRYQTKWYQLLRQVCGITENAILVLTDVSNIPAQENEVLVEIVQNTTNIKHVEHLKGSQNEIRQAKPMLERKVQSVKFQENMPLRYAVLLYIIKCKCKSFWLRRTEIETLSKLFDFRDDDLEKFLMFFTSFGCIFYTHDIPSLREYVIIDVQLFVQHIHQLYNTEETAQFGLFKEKLEEQWKIIFEFLVTLEIAAEVKSNQIIKYNHDLKLADPATYYYIPTARKPTILRGEMTEEMTNPLFPLVEQKCISEILQVCLCKVLLSQSCHLVPTEKKNTTAMKFFNLDEQTITFVDTGNRILIEPMDSDSTITVETRDKVYRMLVSCETLFSRQKLVDSMKAKQAQGKDNISKK